MPRETLRKYGAEGATELPKFRPGSSDKIVSVLDKQHFMHGRVNLARYSLEGDTPLSQALLELRDDVAAKGVEQPGVIWWHDEMGHIISGTRRWVALTEANKARAKNEFPPLAMEFKVNSRWSRDEALEKWRRANERQMRNDLLTRIEGAAIDVERGVQIEQASELWEIPLPQLRAALDPLSGLIVAAPELRDAVASGEIKLARALRLAKLPRAEQAKALLAPTKEAVPRKYMSCSERATLRDMLTALLNGKKPDADKLRALVGKL